MEWGGGRLRYVNNTGPSFLWVGWVVVGVGCNDPMTSGKIG